jgi:hypothetical protein
LIAFALVVLGEKFLDSHSKATAASTFMVTTAQDSGPGSLRQAILDANANAGPDVINFSIGSFQQTIVLSSLLPVITDPVTIDATTQPGFAGRPLIEVKPDGQVIGDGFQITGGNSVIRGLVINSFRGFGIVIETGGGNVIEGNYIGTETTGTVAAANIQSGVHILSSNNNRIGGLTTAARNVISGNGVNGVDMSSGATGNVVQGNYIGLSWTGDFKVPNINTGVSIFSAPNNMIGGATATARNVISGNGTGIVIDTANGTLVQGNFIGTNAAGDAPIVNMFEDFRVVGSNNTLIGGSTATPGTAPGNVIASLFIGGGVQTRVQGNLIGTNAAGTAQLAFTSFGVSMWGDTLLGGSTPDLRNVISGFQTAVLVANSGGGSILGNYIGTDITGTLKIGNSTGISIAANLPTQVGGVNADDGNVVSGNSTGISLESASTGTTVKGNFIGTRKDGTTGLPNSSHGIEIRETSSNNVIGGTEAGAANTIAFNGASGISIRKAGVSFNSTRNRIRGNKIHSNGNLGIDLNADQVTLDDAGDADAGPNGLQNFPNIGSVTTGAVSTIEGTLNSASSSLFTLDFYASSTCDPSGFGQGASYIGSTQANTDTNGNATYSAQFPGLLPTGSVVTATATDALGNTSEFSLCRVVNAPGTVQFLATQYAAQEQAGLATITVSRTFGSTDSGSVDYATSSGTAVTGIDFSAGSGTLTFGPGEIIKSFTVPILDDAIDENAETINLTLSNPTGFTLGSRSTAVVNVADNDPLPTLSIIDASVGEGDSGFTDIQFKLNLSVASGRNVSVRYNTFPGTAGGNIDYQENFTNFTVTFAPGETTKTITARVIGDTEVEPNETFLVNLSLPTNVTLSDNSAVGTIIDDDSLLLLTEQGNQRALSLDSVKFVTDPFPVVNTDNFSSDQRTRIILLATGLKLAAGEDATAITATAEDPQLGVHPLQVEFVGPVPGFNWLTQVVVKLPDSLANKSSALVTITVHAVTSNKALITIKVP